MGENGWAILARIASATPTALVKQALIKSSHISDFSHKVALRISLTVYKLPHSFEHLKSSVCYFRLGCQMPGFYKARLIWFHFI
jgi:hypothetical protein